MWAMVSKQSCDDQIGKSYHTTPYYTIPHHTSPYNTTPHLTIPYHTIPYHTMQYLTISYHTTLHHTIYTIPYHTIPYHTTPYNTISYHTTLHHSTPNQHHTIPPRYSMPSHITPHVNSCLIFFSSGNAQYCWITNPWALAIFFVGPVIAMLVFNTIALIVVLVLIRRERRVSEQPNQTHTQPCRASKNVMMAHDSLSGAG